MTCAGVLLLLTPAITMAGARLWRVSLHSILLPVPRSDRASAQDKNLRIYVIRVIDATSGTPIRKADVVVELQNNKTQWRGQTDALGIFHFTCEPPRRPAPVHISIQAPGYWTLDDYNVLLEERVMHLRKAD
jgi:hypothetical protein